LAAQVEDDQPEAAGAEENLGGAERVGDVSRPAPVRPGRLPAPSPDRVAGQWVEQAVAADTGMMFAFTSAMLRGRPTFLSPDPVFLQLAV
jgi:hypothetical protein